MFHITMLATLALLTLAVSVPQQGVWTADGAAQCWGPGLWPHPAHCRLFSLCHLKTDGKVVGRLLMCPLGTSYSSRHRRCITPQSDATPHCTMSTEDDTLLNSLPAERVSSDNGLQYTCDTTNTSYCADDDILVICGPNNALVGLVNCSAQQKTPPLKCEYSTATCTMTTTTTTVAKAATITEKNDITTSGEKTHDDDSTAEYESSEYTEMISNRHNSSNMTILLLPILSSNAKQMGSASVATTLNSTFNGNTSSSNGYLHIAIPNTSRENDYSDDIYDGDDYDSYEDSGSLLPDFSEIICTEKGIQCVDKTTIVDCSENTLEPLFIMSCSFLIDSNEEEEAVGYCENATCVLSSHGATLSLEINTISKEKGVNECKSNTGLKCIDDETLVACSGDNDTMNYAISCAGTSLSDTNTILKGKCDKASCMVTTFPKNGSLQSLHEDEDMLAEESAIHYTHQMAENQNVNKRDGDRVTAQENESVESYENESSDDSQNENSASVENDNSANLENESSASLEDDSSESETSQNEEINQDSIHYQMSEPLGTKDTKVTNDEDVLIQKVDVFELSVDDELLKSLLQNSSLDNANYFTETPPTDKPATEENLPVATDLTPSPAEVEVPANTDNTPDASHNLPVAENDPFIKKQTPTEGNLGSATHNIPANVGDLSDVTQNLPATEDESATHDLQHMQDDTSHETHILPADGSYSSDITHNMKIAEVNQSDVKNNDQTDESNFPAYENIQGSGDNMSHAEYLLTNQHFLPAYEDYIPNTEDDLLAAEHNIPNADDYGSHLVPPITDDYIGQHEYDWLNGQYSLSNYENALPITQGHLPASEDYAASADYDQVNYYSPYTEDQKTDGEKSSTDFKTTANDNPIAEPEDIPEKGLQTVQFLNNNVSTSVTNPASLFNTTVFPTDTITSDSITSSSQTLHLTTQAKILSMEISAQNPENLSTNVKLGSSNFTPFDSTSPVSETSLKFTPQEVSSHFFKTLSKHISTEGTTTIPEVVHIETLSKPAPTEDTASVLESLSTETKHAASNLTPRYTTSHIYEISKSTARKEISPIPQTSSKFLTEDISFPVHATSPKSMPIKRTSAIHETSSKLIPVRIEGASSVPEAISPVPEIPPKFTPTEEFSPVSETSPTESTIPILKHTPKEKITPIYNNLFTKAIVPEVQSTPTSITKPQYTLQASTTDTKITAPRKHFANEYDERKNSQTNKCFKPGIQCINNVTLGACLSDLTLSYTVPCRTLIPYVTSKQYIVYCIYKLDTCGLAKAENFQYQYDF